MAANDISTIIEWVMLDLYDADESKLGYNDYRFQVERASQEFSLAYPRRAKKILGIQKECHRIDDTTNTIAAASASDTATAITLLNEIKADYNLHRASTTYHKAADSTNTVSSSDATDLSSAITLANEIKDDINAHQIESGVHYTDDLENVITTADAVDEDTLVQLTNEIKVDYGYHLSEETDGRRLYVSDVHSVTGYIQKTGVEFPVDKDPPVFCEWDDDGDDWIKIHTNYNPPDTGDLVFVHYEYEHTLNDSTNTIPSSAHEQLIRLGACGYSMLALAEKRRGEANALITTENYHLTTDDTSVDSNFQDYIETGDDKIPTINVGGDEAGAYLAYANAELGASRAVARQRSDLYAEATYYDKEGNRKVMEFKAELDRLRTKKSGARKPKSSFLDIFQ